IEWEIEKGIPVRTLRERAKLGKIARYLTHHHLDDAKKTEAGSWFHLQAARNPCFRMRNGVPELVDNIDAVRADLMREYEIRAFSDEEPLRWTASTKEKWARGLRRIT